MASWNGMTRRYASEILPIIGPERDIPAPDVGTDEQTMAWFMDTVSVQTGYTVTGVVTGKPVSLGGSQGRAPVPPPEAFSSSPCERCSAWASIRRERQSPSRVSARSVRLPPRC